MDSVLRATSLQFDLASLEFLVLNQTKLPHREEWRRISTPEEAVAAIQCLAVRGAPLIGIVAVLSIAQWLSKKLRAKDVLRWDEILNKAALLKLARPTAVNLSKGIDRLTIELQKAFLLRETHRETHNDEWFEKVALGTAVKLFEEDVKLCSDMGSAGANLLGNEENVLTICNTGALATVGTGTAFSVILEGFRRGKIRHVYACETRPLLQGARLTSWELQKNRIPFTLIGDSMAAALMAQKKVTSVFVGADRIAANGDFANKVGTYSLAVNARYHQIPFYTVAPSTTLDLNCASGATIPIEEREADEMKGCVIPGAALSWTPEGVQVWNPAFDVTPVGLLSGMVVDSQFFSNEQLVQGMLRNLSF